MSNFEKIKQESDSHAQEFTLDEVESLSNDGRKLFIKECNNNIRQEINFLFDIYHGLHCDNRNHQNITLVAVRKLTISINNVIEQLTDFLDNNPIH